MNASDHEIMDAPPIANAEADELRLFDLATQIDQWQKSQPGLSDKLLLLKFPGLGSTKTFRKLVARDADQLSIPAWLPRYESALELIEAESERPEIVHGELSFMKQVYASALQLSVQRGNRRLLVVEGGSGGGKTHALRQLITKLPGSVVFVEANETWTRPAVALADIITAARALRSEEDTVPVAIHDRLARVIEHFQKRRIIVIDEAHHMSGPTLNVIKTIINNTPSCVIIGALDTLWRKLTSTAWQEVKQLIFNRMFARIRIKAPTVADAKLYFAARMSIEGIPDEIWKMILKDAHKLGDMAFLRNMADHCDTLGLNGKLDQISLIDAMRAVRRQIEGND